MNVSVNRSGLPLPTQPSKTTKPVAAPTAVPSAIPAPSKASFESARQQTLGTVNTTINPSQSNQLIKQGIDHADSGQIAMQSEQMLSSSVLAQEFGPPQVPKARGAETIEQARQGLKPVSQHQVLDLGQDDAAVTESGRSLKLKTEGSVFAPERLGPGATLEIVGHGSIDGKLLGGKTPAQLAHQLRAAGVTQLQTLSLKSCRSAGFAEQLAKELDGLGLKVGKIEGFAGRIAIETASGKTLTDLPGQRLEQQSGHSGALGLFDGFVGGNEAMAKLHVDFDQAVAVGNFKQAADLMVPYIAANPDHRDAVVANALRTVGGAPPDAAKLLAFSEGVRQAAWAQLEPQLQTPLPPDPHGQEAWRQDKLGQVQRFAGLVQAAGSPQGMIDAALLCKNLNEPGHSSALLKQAAVLAEVQNNPQLIMRAALELPVDDPAARRGATIKALELFLKGGNISHALQAMQSLHEAAPEDPETAAICLKAAQAICTGAKDAFPAKTLETVAMMREIGALAPAKVINEVFGSADVYQGLMLKTVAEVVTKTKDPALGLNCAFMLRELSTQASPAVITTLVGDPPGEAVGKLQSLAVTAAKSAFEAAKVGGDFATQLDAADFLQDVTADGPEKKAYLKAAYEHIAKNAPDIETALPAIRNLVELVSAEPDSPSKNELKTALYKRIDETLIPGAQEDKPEMVLEGARVLIELEPSNALVQARVVHWAKQVLGENVPALSLEAAQIMNDVVPLLAKEHQPTLQTEVIAAAQAAVAQGKGDKPDLSTMLEAVQLMESMAEQIPRESVPDMLAYVQRETREVVRLALVKGEPETALDALRELQDRATQMAPEGRGDLPAFLLEQSRAVCEQALTQGKPATAIGALSLISEGIDDGVIGAHASISVFLVTQGPKAVDLALAARDPETALAGNRVLAGQVTVDNAAVFLPALAARNLAAGELAIALGDFDIALDSAHQLVDLNQLDKVPGLIEGVKARAQIPPFAGFGFGGSILGDDADRDRFRHDNIVRYTPKGAERLTAEQRDLLNQFSTQICDDVRAIYKNLERGVFPEHDPYKARSFVLRGSGLAAAKMGYTIESVVTARLKAASTYDEATGRYRFNVGGREDKPLYWKAQGSLNLPSSTRPDFFVDLGGKQEALIDLTSQKQKGHIITGKSPNWLGRENITYVREVTYPSMTKSQTQVIRNHLLRGDNQEAPGFQLANQISMVQSQLESGQAAKQKVEETKFVRQIAGNFNGAAFAREFFAGDTTKAAKFMKMYGITKKGINAAAAKPTAEEARALKQSFIKGVKSSSVVRGALSSTAIKSTPFERYATS